MPKKGKTDKEWLQVMKLYAQGLKQFKTGETPGNKKWKNVMRNIDVCPRTRGLTVDLFGAGVSCKCGFHEVC